eukprot:MONOS_3699.1-p1 / transcript=MONOS_3699.1 / gene=MONOS_3699 / organism=Monocercomonoides_exilis_PA203 / gene_product=unspecified product / transcript_product=unspecified product / location=Mono_scaffold00090:11837-12527(+) / protein_length=177 / sequence_SO=supercontig / SO=protein_coding / is_pseudo=false
MKMKIKLCPKCNKPFKQSEIFHLYLQTSDDEQKAPKANPFLVTQLQMKSDEIKSLEQELEELNKLISTTTKEIIELKEQLQSDVTQSDPSLSTPIQTPPHGHAMNDSSKMISDFPIPPQMLPSDEISSSSICFPLQKHTASHLSSNSLDFRQGFSTPERFLRCKEILKKKQAISLT